VNDTQLYLALAVPTLAVFAGMFVNQRALDCLEVRLGGRMDLLDQRMDRIESRLERIEADLREFYRTLGQHDAKIDHLEKGNA
jgi:hypothetical protein